MVNGLSQYDTGVTFKLHNFVQVTNFAILSFTEINM
jgi:hypothetical protein